ncbi:hypothetical protein BDK51DRAFT_36119 [Blyttiomyces helicus]|uniref:Translation initiation factor eIF2B subunit delta n=1 Tax=Blyttiomyces helicus TaxID=388810 RepID=A0A4P9W2F3_9FUNG|nr:hypothetical protein BDK51DRAFT_36119 [Blyttiomyces helicus]|eukprot:RKO86324.1 hypothetical protein BDK51DRAFT_36119 [Blyttiomyces helicus]
MLADLRAQGHIHSAVLTLGLRFSEFEITGGNARCMAMMKAFKTVVSDYVTPAGHSLQRHLVSHISKQVDFLSNTRPLAASMKTAIKYLKSAISTTSPDVPDEDAKAHLRDRIDEFNSHRIVLAGRMIIKTVLEEDKLRDDDVILTYSRSSVVVALLIHAHEQGKKFRVVVTDSRPKFEGKDTLKELVAAGISCTYVMTNALPLVIKEVTKVMLGASAIFSNGAILSRVGTAVVSMAAHDAQVPVIVLCETYKFSDTARLDSFVWNEIGNPDELAQSKKPTSLMTPAPMGALRDWREVDQLKLLNLHYDVTPSKFVTMVICEAGMIPSTSVPFAVTRLGAADRAGN